MGNTTWTLRDAMRLSHPDNIDPAVAEFILHGNVLEAAPEILHTFESLQAAQSESDVVRLLQANTNASWEMIPTEFLKSTKVWGQLFANGLPQTALLRNTKRVHNLGMFDNLKFAAAWGKALADGQAIQRSRVHPINYLNAYIAYKGDPFVSKWLYMYEGMNGRKVAKPVESPNSKIVKALESGYFAAFKNIVPAEKRTLVGLDVSGSMAFFASGIDISCACLGAAFSQMLIKTEPYAMVRGFENQFVDLKIHEDDSLAAVIEKTHNRNFGSTDCSLPMTWALKNKIQIETFVVFTDNDTWSGHMHPHEALAKYRRDMNIPARFVCVAATGTDVTVSDPSDSGSMDVSGFDSSAPKVIADFSAGRI